jgi:hypothetical protein
MYPSRYLGNDMFTDEFEFEFDDTNVIVPNREKIMELLLNDNYEDINKITNTVDMEDEYNEEFKQEIIIELLNDCVVINDIDMFKLLLLKNGQKQILENNNDIIGYIVEANRLNMFMMLIEDVNLDDFYERIYNDIVIFRDEFIIQFLKIMDDMGYKMDNKHIKRIIQCNNVGAMKYLLSVGYDIQIHVNNSNIAMDIIKFDMLKCLVDAGIDISECLLLVINSAIKNDDLDMLIYLHEHFPDYRLNKFFSRCVRLNRINILKYFISIGVNIGKYKITECPNISIDMVKFLIGVGYKTNYLVDKIGDLLIRCFCGDDDIDNFKYLLDVGTDIRLLMKNKKMGMTEESKRWVIYKKDYAYLVSILEYCVSMGKMIQIKFLFDNYFELVKNEIDRLFVIACANGQIEMTKFFKDMNAKLCNKSLGSACYFGHFEIVKMILCWGLEFDVMVENPFVMCIVGMNSGEHQNAPYTSLIDGNDIFRNHIYNYGDGYNDILKLLMVYNISIPHYNDVGIPYLMKLDDDILKYFFDTGMDINLRFEYNNVMVSLMEYAVLKNIKMVKFLLDCSIDCHKMNKQVIRKCHKDKYADIKQLLMDYGFDL